MYSNTNPPSKPHISKKWPIIIGSVLGLLLIVILLEMSNITNFYGNPTSSQKPTQEDNQKDSVEGQIDSDNTQNNGASTDETDNEIPTTMEGGGPKLKAVNPVLTQVGNYGENIEAAGYVAGVFEDGGKCTYTFISGARKVVEETVGAANVKDTTCAPAVIARSKFVTGRWSVTLNYTSSTSSGTSAPGAFNVN